MEIKTANCQDSKRYKHETPSKMGILTVILLWVKIGTTNQNGWLIRIILKRPTSTGPSRVVNFHGLPFTLRPCLPDSHSRHGRHGPVSFNWCSNLTFSSNFSWRLFTWRGPWPKVPKLTRVASSFWIVILDHNEPSLWFKTIWGEHQKMFQSTNHKTDA